MKLASASEAIAPEVSISVCDPGPCPWRVVSTGHATASAVEAYLDLLREGQYQSVRADYQVACPACAGSGWVYKRVKIDRRFCRSEVTCPTCRDAGPIVVATGEWSA